MRSTSLMKLKRQVKETRLVWQAPESDLLQVEGVLDDARCGDAHAQDVLLRGEVLGLGYPLDV